MSTVTVSDSLEVAEVVGVDKPSGGATYKAIVDGQIVHQVDDPNCVDRARLSAFFTEAKSEVIDSLNALQLDGEVIAREIAQGFQRLP